MQTADNPTQPAESIPPKPANDQIKETWELFIPLPGKVK